ncbi:hypothetical protein ACTSKR_13895 [Chitinibacteraceae bacterium HSL-7]
MNTTLRLLSISCATLMLAACGGGGGGGDEGGVAPAPTPTPTPVSMQGVWSGSADGSLVVYGAVLENNRHLFVYSNGSSNAGLLEGASTLNGTAYASTDNRDYNVTGPRVYDATLSGTLADPTLTGQINYGAGSTKAFTLTRTNTYNNTATLAQVTGAYTGSVAMTQGSTGYSDTVVFTLAANGSLSGTSGTGCTATGTLLERDAKDLFRVSVQFGAAPCVQPNLVLSGVAFFVPSSTQFVAALTSADRSTGVVLVGKR